MLTSNSKVIGSIRIGRSIIVVGIPRSILQSLGVPKVPAVGSRVSFLTRYKLWGTAAVISHHIDDSISSRSRW